MLHKKMTNKFRMFISTERKKIANESHVKFACVGVKGKSQRGCSFCL